MGISRGFQRLSLMVGLVGLVVLLTLGFGIDGHLADEPVRVWVFLLAEFVAAPAIFVLLLGWVVAGFRNPN
jgi:hypothetical protein